MKEQKQLEKEAALVVANAAAIVVNDDDSYEIAAESQRGLKELRDKIKAWFDPHVKRAHDAHKALTAERKALLDPVEAAINSTSRAMGAYYAELERQRKEEEAILRQKAADEARQANEQQAVEAEVFMGDKATADALRSVQGKVADMAAATVAVDNLAPELEGSRKTGTWKFEVEDANKIPRDFLTPDLKAIGAFVRARKDAAVIPGVRVYCDYKVSV